jgi:flagellar hook-associated protein 3 FlgL
MRVTPGMIADRVAGGVQRSLAALARQQGMLASGRRINEPADDPDAMAQAHILRSRQTANEQFAKNVAAARAGLQATDTTLGSLVDAFIRAREMAIQGSNDTNDALARSALGSAVDQLIEEAVTLANSRGPRGTMLFAGQESLTAPYEVTRDVAGRITAVTPNARGIDGQVVAEVSEGVTVSTSVSGTDVFGDPADPDYAFTALIALRDALELNDAVAVRASLDTLAALADRATLAATVTGSRLGWLSVVEERLADESLLLTTSLSRAEALDYVKAIGDLQQIQAAHEAGLASAARLLQQSLLDFLR